MTVLHELNERGRAAADALSDDDAAFVAALIADTVACSAAGFDHPFAAGMRAMHVGERSSVRAQIFTEAALSHVDEIDAIHPRSAILPCATIVAPALTLATRHDRSGADLVRAVVAGAEVAIEAGLRFGGAGLYGSGWWPTALFGGVGAALACSLLLGHDSPSSLDAMAIAANGLGGLLSSDELGAGHYLLVGRAAADGYLAALAAGAGLSASAMLLDGPATAALRAPAPATRASARPHLLDSAVKCYPCARPLHPVVEALAQLRAQGVDPMRTTPIRVGLPAPVLRFVTAERSPAGPAEAAASAAWVIAAVSAGRADDPAFFRSVSADIEAPEVELFAVADLEARFPERWGAIVELPSGHRVVADNARGGADDPWTTQERRAKFLRLIQRQWPRDEALAWLDTAEGLIRLPGVAGWAARRPNLV
jgi:2-methylcitrate dehydratase PrpD